MRFSRRPEPPASSDDRVLCSQCGSRNQRGQRFCVACGHLLAQARAAGDADPQSVASASARADNAAGLRPAAAAGARSTVPIAAPTTRGELVFVERDGREGAHYPVAETCDIGRTEGSVLVSHDAYVSPRHARIFLRGGSYFLRDLGSLNGVFCRIPFGKPLSLGPPMDLAVEQPLADQELFLIGQQVLKFEVVRSADEGFGVASENGTLLFGSAAGPRFARLSQRTVEGVSRDVFYVRKPETTLGRESADVVFTDDPYMSRQHALLRMYGTGESRRFALSDLGSSNGTFVQIREEVQLHSGAQLRIGQQLFRFDIDAGRTA